MVEGMVSVNPIPVSWAVPGLIKVILIVETAPPVTKVGKKRFDISIASVVPPDTVNLAVRLLAGCRS
jgi:hypothetical protein